MPEVPAQDAEEETTVVTDGYFEEEFNVPAADAGEFLVELGKQLQSDEEVLVSGDGWEIPFAFGDPVELEVEFAGDGDPELEVEVELPAASDDEAPDIA